MLATISLLIGLLLGVAVLALGRRAAAAGQPASGTTTPAWLTLGFGLVALVAFAGGTGFGSGPGNSALGWLNLSIALGFAAVVAGIGLLRRGVRGWPIWAGLLAGLIPAIFWIWFALGNLLA